jgi:hypothetical protein
MRHPTQPCTAPLCTADSRFQECNDPLSSIIRPNVVEPGLHSLNQSFNTTPDFAQKREEKIVQSKSRQSVWSAPHDNSPPHRDEDRDLISFPHDRRCNPSLQRGDASAASQRHGLRTRTGSGHEREPRKASSKLNVILDLLAWTVVLIWVVGTLFSVRQ